MNKLLVTLIAGVFAAASTVAIAQSEATKLKEDIKKAQDTPRAKAFAEQQKAMQDASKSDMSSQQQKANVEASKMEPRTKAKYSEKQAQQESSNSATNPQQAAANVAASKAQGPREKMPDIKKLTKEQRAELLRQLQKESTP